MVAVQPGTQIVVPMVSWVTAGLSAPGSGVVIGVGVAPLLVWASAPCPQAGASTAIIRRACILFMGGSLGSWLSRRRVDVSGRGFRRWVRYGCWLGPRVRGGRGWGCGRIDAAVGGAAPVSAGGRDHVAAVAALGRSEHATEQLELPQPSHGRWHRPEPRNRARPLAELTMFPPDSRQLDSTS